MKTRVGWWIMKSRYVVQETERSHCPKCQSLVRLLIPEDCDRRLPAFYLCHCGYIAEVGVGEVPGVGAVLIKR